MLTIGEFSKTSNVTAKTLRYYDDIGLLKPAYINKENGYRFYDVAQLKTMLLINKLKQYHFTLEEIASVLQTSSNHQLLLSLLQQKQLYLQMKLAEYQQILTELMKDTSNLENGKTIMENFANIPVELMNTQPQNILFVRKAINVKAYDTLMAQLKEKIAKEKPVLLGPPMTIYHSEEFTPENYDIEIAVPVQNANETTRPFGGVTCAKITYKGLYSNFPAIYTRLKEWMDTNGYTLAGPTYEVYQTDPFVTPPEENLTEIYAPVKK